MTQEYRVYHESLDPSGMVLHKSRAIFTGEEVKCVEYAKAIADRWAGRKHQRFVVRAKGAMMNDGRRIINVPEERLNKPTKAGVKAALIAMTYDYFPAALKDVAPAESYTQEEWEWADYLVYDTDCGGAWDEADQYQINDGLT